MGGCLVWCGCVGCHIYVLYVWWGGILVIFWVHLVSSCIIFCGRCGSSFFRLVVVMGIPLAILSLMMEYACGMVVVVVLWWG